MPIVGDLITIPVKTSVLVLLNPVTSAKDKYLSSHQASAELILAMKGEGLGGYSPKPTNFWRSGKKCVTFRKSRMTQMTPHSRV